MKSSVGFLAGVLGSLLVVAGCGGSGPSGGSGGSSGSGASSGDGNPGEGEDGGAVVDGGMDPQCGVYSNITGGSACSVEGLTCPSGAVLVDCNGGEHPLSCYCTGTSWTCEHGTAACAMPTCLPPDEVVNGAYCQTIGQSCPSTAIPVPSCNGTTSYTSGTCSCTQFGWSCPDYPPPPCAPPPPPPTCPDAATIFPYQTCYVSSTIECAGNPKVCGSATFYDAFECDGYWRPIATTICGNVPDASVVDAGAFFDGEAVSD